MGSARQKMPPSWGVQFVLVHTKVFDPAMVHRNYRPLKGRSVCFGVRWSRQRGTQIVTFSAYKTGRKRYKWNIPVPSPFSRPDLLDRGSRRA